VRIAVSTERLSYWGGTETYVLTLADHLQQLGHEVWVVARRTGRASAWARVRGIRVLQAEEQLPADLDLIVSNTAPLAVDLAIAQPEARHLWVAHSTLSPLQMPPPADVAHRIVAMNDRVRRWSSAVAGVGPVVRLRQPIDVRRFSPRGTLPERPRRLLLLGNYLAGERMTMIQEVAAKHALEVTRVGLLGHQEDAIEEAIGAADIVVGYGRSILEAMACGRAAYVLDRHGGDGWVTPERYPALEADGFAGTGTDVTLTRARFDEDLIGYDAAMGTANRDLVLSGHKAHDHTASLLDVAADVPAQKGGSNARADRFDLASAVRASATITELVDGLNRHVQVLAERIGALERERDALLAAKDRLERELAVVRIDADWARAVQGSRRFRLLQALLRPVDRLRGSR
jgi:hypothetical protein